MCVPISLSHPCLLPISSLCWLGAPVLPSNSLVLVFSLSCLYFSSFGICVCFSSVQIIAAPSAICIPAPPPLGGSPVDLAAQRALWSAYLRSWGDLGGGKSQVPNSSLHGLLLIATFSNRTAEHIHDISTQPWFWKIFLKIKDEQFKINYIFKS